MSFLTLSFIVNVRQCVQCTLTFIGRQFFKRWRDECDDEDDYCHYGEAHTVRLRIAWHNSRWNETKDWNKCLLVYLLYNEVRTWHFTFTVSNSIPIVKWETFRAELSFMFADLTDEQHAFMLMSMLSRTKMRRCRLSQKYAISRWTRLLSFWDTSCRGFTTTSVGDAFNPRRQEFIL